MKKIIIMALMAVVSLTAAAQIEKGTRFGIDFTGSMSKYSDTPGAKNMFGYGAGFVAEYNFTSNIYLGTGADFVIRGTKLQLPFINGNLKSKNLMVPLNIGGRVNLSDNLSLFAQAGPYASFALKKAEMQVLGSDDLKGESFDWGLNAKVGAEYKHFQFFGGYELGMKKIWMEQGKNRSVVFGVAYMY